MRIILLAIRNLARNYRRSLLTALAVVFGATAIVCLQGFVDGMVRMSIEVSVYSKVGAVQVHKLGYIGSDDPLKQNFADDPALVARIKAVPGVTAVAPRIAFDGMVSNGSESTIFLATAIDPTTEYKVCPRRETYIAAGSRNITAGNNRDVVIGKTLADALGAKQGATLVMQSAGPNSVASNALDVDVVGFLPTLNLLASKRMATVSLGFAQDLLRMKGHITEYVVGVEDLDEVDNVAARVRAALGSAYDVTTWREMDLQTSERVGMIGWVLGFVALILFFLVATGIVNTMLMSVYERVREIGTMLAVGMRRRQVTALFMWEAIALGFLGATGGAGIGYGILRVIFRKGIVMHPPGGDVTVIYPRVSMNFLLVVVAFTVAGTVLAALYPAWKASRLRPVDALRAT